MPRVQKQNLQKHTERLQAEVTRLRQENLHMHMEAMFWREQNETQESITREYAKIFHRKNGRKPLEAKILGLLSARPLSMTQLLLKLSPIERVFRKQVLRRLESQKLIYRKKEMRQGRGRPATYWHLMPPDGKKLECNWAADLENEENNEPQLTTKQRRFEV